MAALALLAGLSYLVGCLPTGILVGRAWGIRDIRAAGSGSAGATNVWRLAGFGPALLVAAADGAKGALAAGLLPRWIESAALAPRDAALLAGGCAVLGHVWPILSGFRGGKGVATAGGVVLVLEPLAFALAALVFVVTALIVRRVSAASLAAASSLPIGLVLVSGRAVEVAFGACLALALWWTHRSNVRRLLAGTEPRPGER